MSSSSWSPSREELAETEALVRLLVAQPSVNPTLDPTGSGEARVASVACDWLRAHAIRAWTEDAGLGPGRPNAVAEVGSTDSSAPTLVLCGHLDTVSVAGMTIDPFLGRVREGRLEGRGAYDMKGGVAAAMLAAARLAETGVPQGGRLLLALVADEEVASAGAQSFVDRHRADACVVVEPSEERLILAHKGFVWIEVELRGRAAHGSRFDLGRSAVTEAGRLLVALDRFDRETLRHRSHLLTGPASLHPATVEGGSGWSTYAERAIVRIERRTIPGETADEARAEIERLATEVLASDASDATSRIERVEIVLARPPLECDRDSSVARALRSGARDVLGRDPEESGVAYWMDAAIFAAVGVPTVDYGPAGAGAHEAVEWVDLASVARTARVLERAAREYFTG